jgi:glycosyltransferase 2 family protein
VKRLFLWGIRLCITARILYYLFTKVSFSEVINSIISARLSYVLIAYLTLVFMRYIVAFRMKLLTDMQGMSLSTLQILGIGFSTIFYGLFLPGGYLTGGLVRWHKLSKPDNKPAEAVAAIIFDNIVDISTLCTLGILFWVLDKPSDRSYIGLSLGTVLGGLLIFLIFTKTILTPLRVNTNLIKLAFIPEIIRGKVNNLIISLSQYQNLSRGYLVILILSFAYHLLGIIGPSYLYVLSLNIDLSFITIAWVRSVLYILSMLPISISGFGVREGTMVFLLRPYGVSTGDAIALSLLYFGGGLWIGTIGGLLEAKNLFWPTRSKSNEK